MASNTRAYADITDYEDYPDWIELHNSSTEEISLAGYFISDDIETPLKWGFAANATIKAGEHLVIIADGNDAPLGTSFRRPYWPFGQVVTEKHHTNFSLSASGEELVLSKHELITNSDLITFGSDWKYLDDGSDQNAAWRTLTYDDSTWSSGPAPLGYGDNPATIIDFGDEEDRHITSYFRQKFTFSDPSMVKHVALRFQVDDAARVFLNGMEIARKNLPNGSIDYLTESLSAITQDFEGIIHRFDVSPDLLIPGENIIAVEVHQTSKTSIDMRFDLELEAISFQNLLELERLTYPQQVTDVSLGRDPLDESKFVNFTTATPGVANSGTHVNDLRMTSGEAEFTLAPGVYANTQTVGISGSGPIHFTTDGQEPTENDAVFSEPITVSENTVIRACVIEPGKISGPILTGTFLIGESFSANIPFLSIVADPDTFFDDRIGIYLNQHERITGIGPAVYKGKDAPGNLELFTSDGSAGFSVNGAFRMGGENNWASHFQRAFNFVLRGKYGDDKLEYDLYPGRDIPIFTALTIREGGDDYAEARISDPVFDLIAKDHLEVATNKSRPSEVFINGEYWGHYNIRDRWDDNWFFQHFGVNDGEYDQIAFDGTSESSMRVENGTVDAWRDFYDFIRTSDLTDPDVWAFVESRMEVDSFIDFLAAESWGQNTSWTGNREVWKPHRAGSKWRWMIPDMDRTFRDPNAGEFEDMASKEQIFKYLKASPIFIERLSQRISAHLATTFEKNRIHTLIDQMGNEVLPTVNRTRARWGNTLKQSDYSQRLVEMKDFALSRTANLQSEIRDTLDLGAPINLTMAIAGMGSVKIAGVDVPAMQLPIFPNIETQIEAIPAPGYQFDRWIGNEGGSSATFTVSDDTFLIANFIPIETPPLGGELIDNTILEAGKIYDISSDLIIPEGVILSIEEGVTLRLDPNVNIRVMGVLNVTGSSDAPVAFQNRLEEPWGGLSFETPLLPSTLTNLNVRGATRGKDPTIYPSAISGLDAELRIDFLDISGERGPLFFRGGSIKLSDSVIDIPITGDGINIKQGAAITERCTFTGNSSPDTDAIDYDGVTDGIIRDCRIYNFRGFNSDGIDTGEQCVNCLIEGNTIYFNSDKGISVGQGSEVIARNNVIIGAHQGIGIKDKGSTILLDQNTFVDCAEGVAVFEKNYASGGGAAIITNCIFSDCAAPVTVDSLSTVSVDYSLSNTTILSGIGNILASPLFVNESDLDFALSPNSPAIDSGDPLHVPDLDGSRADMGAAYIYSANDFPYLFSNTVVVNEILANSGLAGDWVELHNRTARPIDISGWSLSDDGSNLQKYIFPEGSILNGGAYLALTEEEHFGINALDPGRQIGFALSATGETMHLSSPKGYSFKETFGASEEGVAFGFYFKASSNSYNFVAQDSPSQGFTNGSPAVGPVIISEIMYAPSGAPDAEYLELLNISDTPVTLFDSEKGEPWKMTDGIEFTFPADSPVTIGSGERIILTLNLEAFNNQFFPPANTVIYQWTGGRLSNGGEIVQLGKPGLTDEFGESSYIRVDRVNYDNSNPWPITADGNGPSLSRIIESVYGNDYINWRATPANPGEAPETSALDDWMASYGVINLARDVDQDGIDNLLEYTIGSDPTVARPEKVLDIAYSNNISTVTFPASYLKPDLNIILEASEDLVTWSEVSYQSNAQVLQAIAARTEARFYRLRVALSDPN